MWQEFSELKDVPKKNLQFFEFIYGLFRFLAFFYKVAYFLHNCFFCLKIFLFLFFKLRKLLGAVLLDLVVKAIKLFRIFIFTILKIICFSPIAYKLLESLLSFSISDFISETTDKRLLLGTLINRFTTGYLRRAYQVFDGDLAMALVFGEIAQYNISRALRTLMAESKKKPQHWKQLVKAFELEKVAPCNALSISEATGVPRETVRRKVRELEARNWLVREGTNRLSVSPDVSGQLESFSLEILMEFIATMHLVSDLPEPMARQLASLKNSHGRT